MNSRTIEEIESFYKIRLHLLLQFRFDQYYKLRNKYSNSNNEQPKKMERDEIIHVYGRQPNQLRYVNIQLRCQKGKPHVTISNYEHRSIIKSAIFKMIESANSMFAKKTLFLFFCFPLNNDCFSSSLLIWSSVKNNPIGDIFQNELVSWDPGRSNNQSKMKHKNSPVVHCAFYLTSNRTKNKEIAKCIHACTLCTLCTDYTVEWKTKIQTRQRSNT